MKLNKFKIDLNRKDIPEDIKDFVVKQAEFISNLNDDNKTLKSEQKKLYKIIEELKKNLI